MKFDAFFDMLTMVYIHLLYSIQSAAMVNDVIASILRDAQSQGVVIGTEGVRYLDRAGLTLGGATSTSASGAARRANIMKIDDEEDDLGGGVSHEDINMPSSNTSTTASSANAAKASSVFDSNANMTDSTPAAASTYAQMLEESAEIVHAISDLAHMRCSKLVGVRAEQNAQLNPKDFYRLFGATWEFVRGGEALNGRPCFGLKSTMLSQVMFRHFINTQAVSFQFITPHPRLFSGKIVLNGIPRRKN